MLSHAWCCYTSMGSLYSCQVLLFIFSFRYVSFSTSFSLHSSRVALIFFLRSFITASHELLEMLLQDAALYHAGVHRRPAHHRLDGETWGKASGIFFCIDLLWFKILCRWDIANGYVSHSFHILLYMIFYPFSSWILFINVNLYLVVCISTPVGFLVRPCGCLWSIMSQ